MAEVFYISNTYEPNLYSKEHGFKHSEAVYVGDDYGFGGNDGSVFLADYNFIKLGDYTDFPKVAHLL